MKQLYTVALALLSVQATLGQERDASLGGVFTPKGDLRALVVLVEFAEKPSLNPNFTNAEDTKGWPAGQALPDGVDVEKRSLPQRFFQNIDEFEQPWEPQRDQHSQFFYTMSGGKFRFLAELFCDSSKKPTVLRIDTEGAREWTYLNKKVWQEMQRLNPGFDYARFDQRKNNPQYRFDNSQSQPDSLIDYMIILYRYDHRWQQAPHPSMSRWPGATGGFASIGSFLAEERSADGRKPAEGFTMMYSSSVFIHEIAHSLYNCPHVFGVNQVLGEYWQASMGWGTMAGNTMFEGMNAWERWYAGFTEPQRMRYKASEARAEQEFLLRDFVPTGDALAIEIPFSKGQYLWLEYRAGQHPWDRHGLEGQSIGEHVLPSAASGIYAYIEGIASERSQIIQALSPAANAMKLLYADGHYDYRFLRDSAMQRNAWGGRLYYLQKGKESPAFGAHPMQYQLWNYKGEQVINRNRNYNSGSGQNNLQQAVLQEIDGQWTPLYYSLGCYYSQYAWHNRGPAFAVGQELSMSSNPLPLRLGRFLEAEDRQEAIELNGLQVEFLPSRAGDPAQSRRIRVRYGQVELQQSRRWAGPLVLPNISQDEQSDLRIKKRKTLRLAQDELAQKTGKNSPNDFQGQTVLRIEANACLELEAGARLILERGTRLVLEPGARLLLGSKARIVCRGGQIEGLDAARLKLGRRARVACP